MENSEEAYDPDRPEIISSILTSNNSNSSINSESSLFTNGRNVNPSTNGPLTIRVLHRQQGGKGPLKFLLSVPDGWIDAYCFAGEKNVHGQPTFLKVNHCYTIKKWRLDKVKTDKGRYYSTFSGNKLQLDISNTLLSEIKPSSGTVNCISYIPFEFQELNSVLLTSTNPEICDYQFDAIGVIHQVSDIRDAGKPDSAYKDVVIKDTRKKCATSTMIKCKFYGELAKSVVKKDVGKVLAFKNGKIAEGVIWLSDSLSCVFKIAKDEDAFILSPVQRAQYYDPIKMKPTPQKRPHDENRPSTSQRQVKRRLCTTQASDFKNFKTCTIQNLIKDLPNHTMTDVKVTLQDVQMTLSLFEYKGCQKCFSSVKTGKGCPKCKLSEEATLVGTYEIARDIEIYQAEDSLGKVSPCFGNLAVQIKQMENADSFPGLKEGLHCKTIPFICLHGVKDENGEGWSYKIKSISNFAANNIKDEDETENLSFETQDASGSKQNFADLNPLVVNVVKPRHKNTRPGNAKCYQVTSTPKGLVLIINNQYFLSSKNGEPHLHHLRPYSEIDEKYITELFTQMGYDVYHKHDKLAEELPDILEEFKRKLVELKVDSAFIFVMSEGVNDHILMVNDHVHVFEDIIYKFTNEAFPEMSGKPKGFFFQSCRGFTSHNSVKKEGQTIRNDDDQPNDIFISFSSPPGFVSRRYVNQGSIYIYKMCEIIMKCSHSIDLVTIMEQLRQEMLNYEECQIPENRSFLTKTLYLQ